jgi:hypothetical protein
VAGKRMDDLRLRGPMKTGNYVQALAAFRRMLRTVEATGRSLSEPEIDDVVRMMLAKEEV